MVNGLQQRLTKEDNVWLHTEVEPYNSCPVIRVDFENTFSVADAREMFDRVCRNLRFRKVRRREFFRVRILPPSLTPRP